MSRRKWTHDEVRKLTRSYGRVHSDTLSFRLNRSVSSLRCKATRLGLTSDWLEGLWSVADAAAEAGVDIWDVYGCAHRGLIDSVHTTKRLWITEKGVEQLRELYPPPPDRWITLPQTCSRLGYAESHVHRLLRAGVLCGVMRGGRWCVDVDSIERIEAELRLTGRARLRLPDLPAIEVMRERSRLYMRARREAA